MVLYGCARGYGLSLKALSRRGNSQFSEFGLWVPTKFLHFSLGGGGVIVLNLIDICVELYQSEIFVRLSIIIVLP